MNRPREYHRPVMADEVVALLRPVVEGVVVDATYGGGGHTKRVMEAMGERVRMIGIDRDPDAHREVVEGVTFLAGDFRHLADLLDKAGIGDIAAVVFDFGVSGHQLDESRRGFSYRLSGPLDMRMDPAQALTADELVNSRAADELAGIIRRYGEEPSARRVAAAIVANRPIRDTVHLAEVVASAIPARDRRRGHPARKTFQALRIAVNDELSAVADGLEAGLERLRPGGRCVAIAYHSLEDRIVKRRFAAGATGCTCPPELPVCGCGTVAELKILTRSPMRPSRAEVDANPRARSARLRAAERVAA
ncbi:MAG: 16S rRNA (cytosine(1402)-N(4))-methyltransferase RsmH [Acidimicrobiia bacterium]